MTEKPRGTRQESQETYLSGPELLNVWEREFIKTEQKLNLFSNLNSLVDVIRTSGMRTKIANKRDEEFPNLYFDHWEKSWALLKWRALLEAVDRRAKGDKDILIAYSIPHNQPEDYQERLIFVFLTKPKPYRTSTFLSSLTSIVSRKDLMALLGNSDQLPKLPKRKTFYFD